MPKKTGSEVGIDQLPLERFGDIETVGELTMPWVGQATPLVMLTAAVPPGVQWHCTTCKHHDNATTLLQRPKHCGSDMELDDWRSVYDYFGV